MAEFVDKPGRIWYTVSGEVYEPKEGGGKGNEAMFDLR